MTGNLAGFAIIAALLLLLTGQWQAAIVAAVVALVLAAISDGKHWYDNRNRKRQV